MAAVFHTSGEEFLLSLAFGGESVPEIYYVGLDAREELDAADTMADITGEPEINGYVRQQIDFDGWTVELHDGSYRAVSPILTFSASGGSWGPVSNVFVTDAADDSGTLIASAQLQSERTLANGEQFHARISLSLSTCS